LKPLIEKENSNLLSFLNKHFFNVQILNYDEQFM
jgi:hypothetical protein